MIINHIIITSGGQSGVDRAALDFALNHGIDCGGWCPSGRLAEDGVIPDHYPLCETATENPAERTRLNVEGADGTLIIFQNSMDEGTHLTLQVVNELSKPAYIISINSLCDPAEFRGWLEANNIKILNIAGPRESSSKGTYEFAARVLQEILC